MFDAVGAATNQVMAIYEMGPWATAVERVMKGFAADAQIRIVSSVNPPRCGMMTRLS